MLSLFVTFYSDDTIWYDLCVNIEKGQIKPL